MSGIRLRPSVRWFAEQMERRLREHDRDRGPRGWQEEGPQYLLDRLHDEVEELERALKSQDIGGEHSDRVIFEAADVANFAMMIADNEEQAR